MANNKYVIEIDPQVMQILALADKLLKRTDQHVQENMGMQEEIEGKNMKKKQINLPESQDL